MLIDYNLDTKEEEIVPRALELRKRIAGRRISRAIRRGFIDDQQLLKLKQISVIEMREQRIANIDILHAESGLRSTQERTTQQLDIHHSLHLLNRDLQRASRLSRTRLDALSDIEKRVLRMKENLKANVPIPSVPERISMDLRVNNSQKLDQLFTICQICDRKILNTLFEDHSMSCKKLAGKQGGHESRPAVFNVHQDLLTSITTFLPQAPRNFRVVRKGCSFFDFVWDPPVFDGGLPVTDYEIDYKKQIDTFDKATKLWTRRIESMTPVRTSQWCMRDPICHRGYRLKNLIASSTYVDFRVRCCNLRGFGDYVDLQNGSSIRTEDPDAPTKPLFFQTDQITSSCIHLSWSPPIFDGGVNVVEYRISYVVLERVFLATSRTQVSKKPNTVRTKNPVTR
jgi:hypothetical protein